MMLSSKSKPTIKREIPTKMNTTNSNSKANTRATLSKAVVKPKKNLLKESNNWTKPKNPLFKPSKTLNKHNNAFSKPSNLQTKPKPLVAKPRQRKACPKPENALAKPKKVNEDNILLPFIISDKKSTMITPQDIYRMRVTGSTNQIESACRHCNFRYLHAPRHGKPLVVFDFDVLIISSESKEYPSLSKLLQHLYDCFDLAIWSSLTMPYLVLKLESLGLLSNLNRFKFNFLLDRTSMIKAYQPSKGLCQVKDMEIIWNFYPRYTEHNSVMLNDKLKKTVFDCYGVPISRSRRDRELDKMDFMILIEFLLEFIKAKHSFAALNPPLWKPFNANDV